MDGNIHTAHSNARAMATSLNPAALARLYIFLQRILFECVLGLRVFGFRGASWNVRPLAIVATPRCAPGAENTQSKNAFKQHALQKYQKYVKARKRGMVQETPQSTK